MKYLIASMLAVAILSACSDNTTGKWKYVVVHQDGSITLTNTRPELGDVVVCQRGPIRSLDIINKQVSHSNSLTDYEAQELCDKSIR